MRAVLAVAASLALVGCGAAAEEEGRQIAASALKDPASAQFRDVRAYASLANQAAGERSINRVCGQVNGKNSFGAYSGFQRFYVDLDAGTVRYAPEAPEDFSTPDRQAAGYEDIVFDAEYGAGCGR